jgi:beta-galactosidase
LSGQRLLAKYRLFLVALANFKIRADAPEEILRKTSLSISTSDRGCSPIEQPLFVTAALKTHRKFQTKVNPPIKLTELAQYYLLNWKMFSHQDQSMALKHFCTFLLLLLSATISWGQATKSKTNQGRERILLDDGWSFFKYDSETQTDTLVYDVRPPINDANDNKAADTKPTEATKIASSRGLKPWILPTANPFIKASNKKHTRPAGNPGKEFPFVKVDFDDSNWKKINLPHDWAIDGPFQEGWKSEVGGGMGRLPVNGVAWYRKKINLSSSDAGKSIFLDVEGAMSYAMVWLNGNLVGGWPYGYNSWRVDLTPYVIHGGVNQLAIRVDNPNHSARWYPGGGIYRHVWLTKTNPVHVGQWGTYLTTKNISTSSATIDLQVTIDNNSKEVAEVKVDTKIYALNAQGKRTGNVLTSFPSLNSKVKSGENATVTSSASLKNPKRWGPPPTQTPSLYVALTTVYDNKGTVIDEYETRFGIRSLEFHSDKGLLVNGERIQIKGVNQHHDLGGLGAAFNVRAAERQLEILREMGCNAIRMSHNPPAPELLDLTDRMGFLVFDEIFDSWERKKTPHDFHLIFQDWSEPDARSFIRRDRNCPSVIIWGMGNEVGEQYTGDEGAAVAQRLYNIIKEEDPTRPITCAMNFAKSDMPLPKVLDIISLNYQGEGIRQSPEFEGTDRIRTVPQYDLFHKQFPDKMILSSETASAFSSRGVYLFPVSKELSAPVRDGRGGDSKIHHVTSYELHAVDFGSSAEKVFGSLERHPFVAGEFVWTGWDHLGEPTPYYEARSAYCGMIDLAGFRKDRFYLYQSYWRPELPMAYILPHWNWEERVGQITPVHVFTSGDEAELFLNGKSLGRKKKELYHYRLRWDSVAYQPGELKVVAYNKGKKWAESKVMTTGPSAKLMATADRPSIDGDGSDLSFITVQISDQEGNVVPRSNNLIDFSIEGPGEIIAVDNGDPTSMASFSSLQHHAFNGLCLVVVRSFKNKTGSILVKAKSAGLSEAVVKVNVK